jgi:hypothetical protein
MLRLFFVHHWLFYVSHCDDTHVLTERRIWLKANDDLSLFCIMDAKWFQQILHNIFAESSLALSHILTRKNKFISSLPLSHILTRKNKFISSLALSHILTRKNKFISSLALSHILTRKNKFIWYKLVFSCKDMA